MALKKETRFNSLTELKKYQDVRERHLESVDKRDPLTSWVKNQFRKSPEWKSFVKDLINEKGQCERCGGNHDLIVHHRDPNNYKDLTPNKFVVLCSSCHLKIESFCGTEEKMKQCPNIDKPFLTFYPYQDKNTDVLARQSGYRVAKKWADRIDAQNNPGKWFNVTPVSDRQKSEMKDGIEFMKQHPELFK